MSSYIVSVRFVAEDVYQVEAESAEKAIEYVKTEEPDPISVNGYICMLEDEDLLKITPVKVELL